MTGTILLSRRALLGLAAALALASPALAHHGWGWTRDDWFELSGTITEIYVGNPHVTLTVLADGTEWDVDLSPLSSALAAGFDETVAKVGDEVTVIGHRALDDAETHMKAVRVVIDGTNYDVYPGRAADYDRQKA
jgi:hypothetical protein